MRVVGYIRESADPSDGRSAFGQQEEIRRHAAEHGHLLVAICQDLRNPGHSPNRDGYLSLLGVIAAGGVDGVILSGVATFSSDAIVQEIMLRDLRVRGVGIISTDSADIRLLDPHTPPEPSRMLIRDVLERVEEHTQLADGRHIEPAGSQQIDEPGSLPNGDVLVHIIHADTAEQEPAAQADDR